MEYARFTYNDIKWMRFRGMYSARRGIVLGGRDWFHPAQDVGVAYDDQGREKDESLPDLFHLMSNTIFLILTAGTAPEVGEKMASDEINNILARNPLEKLLPDLPEDEGLDLRYDLEILEFIPPNMAGSTKEERAGKSRWAALGRFIGQLRPSQVQSIEQFLPMNNTRWTYDHIKWMRLKGMYNARRVIVKEKRGRLHPIENVLSSYGEKWWKKDEKKPDLYRIMDRVIFLVLTTDKSPEDIKKTISVEVNIILEVNTLEELLDCIPEDEAMNLRCDLEILGFIPFNIVKPPRPGMMIKR